MESELMVNNTNKTEILNNDVSVSSDVPIIKTEQKIPKKRGRKPKYETDEQKREWYEGRKQGMREYYKKNRERLDKKNYQAFQKRMKLYSLVSKDEAFIKLVQEKGYKEKVNQLYNSQEN
jgi:hypothetical protein